MVGAMHGVAMSHDCFYTLRYTPPVSIRFAISTRPQVPRCLCADHKPLARGGLGSGGIRSEWEGAVVASGGGSDVVEGGGGREGTVRWTHSHLGRSLP